MLQKLKITLSLAVLLTGIAVLSQASALAVANSATDPPCPIPAGSSVNYLHPKASDGKYQDNCVEQKTIKNCGNLGVDPSDKTKCQTLGNGCAGNTESTCLAKNPIIRDLRVFVNALSGIVGVVVVAMIMVGGIQYSSARDNATAVSAARKRIANAVVALIIYFLIFAFLQWLIPGGVFNGS